jgi:hypothetical protein
MVLRRPECDEPPLMTRAGFDVFLSCRLQPAGFEACIDKPSQAKQAAEKGHHYFPFVIPSEARNLSFFSWG